MPSARTHHTLNACTPKPRSYNQTSRNWPASKSSEETLKAMQKADHSRNPSSFLDSKHFGSIPLRQDLETIQQNRRTKIITGNLVGDCYGYRFSPNKSSAVHKKTNTLRSCLRWIPKGRIFNTIGLRWVPTGKTFTSSTTKGNQTKTSPNSAQGVKENNNVPHFVTPCHELLLKSSLQRVIFKCTQMIKRTAMASADNTSGPFLKEKKSFKKDAAQELKFSGSLVSTSLIGCSINKFASTNIAMYDEFANQMTNKFKMSMIGQMSFFLGLQISQSPRGIFIDQSKYASEIVKKWFCNTYDSVDTSIIENKKLDEDLQGKPVDVTLYCGMIGSLMYLTSSRPDLNHAVCLCARFQAKPTEKHLQADIPEGDFPRLRINDIEDVFRIGSQISQGMIYQKHINVTKPGTTRLDLKKRHPYTPYKDPQGFIYVDEFKRNRLMRSDELYKFNDGTLTRLLSSLEDITKNIDMEYLPKRRWSTLEKKRAHFMIKDINKLLKERRMMKSLEKFVGDRLYGTDLRLLQRTI
ncbi:integrase, catalytic region, zinc finger, CCHC-type containing protein [Tanacetum coccineum]